MARKRPAKPTVEKPAADFKLTSPEKPELKIKKSKERLEPSVILDEILKNDVRFDIPKALPTVDFMDESSSNKRHNKQKKHSNIDYANESVKKFEPPVHKKKPKVKFSKLSNPFPNDPSKKTAIKEKQQKSPLKDQKPSKSGPSSSSNSNVFTSDAIESLNIDAFAIRNLHELLNFTKLTHVQQKAIPPALEGKDLLIRSPTGKFIQKNFKLT